LEALILNVAIIGVGNRGFDAYGKRLCKYGDVKIVSIVDGNRIMRERAAKYFGVDPALSFVKDDDFFESGIETDGIVISTSDREHYSPLVKSLEKNCVVLLEKPISDSLEQLGKVKELAGKGRARVVVAHVLRYTPFFNKLKDILSSGRIGKVVGIEYKENTAYYHFAHSYVRGNWNNTIKSAPLIIAKSCHDLDILQWFANSRAERISSQGRLVYFKKQNKPLGSAERCLQCPESIEGNCPFSARKIYLGENTEWPVSTISTDLSYNGRYRAVENGPYGRCVYSCDNNMPDYQQVQIVFGNGTIANLIVTAFTNDKSRTLRMFGTKGEIRAIFNEDGNGGEIEVTNFGEKSEIVPVPSDRFHGGGDGGIVEHFVQLMRNKDLKPRTSLDESLESHYMGFAAEISRENNGIPVEMKSIK
jgi:predicted dehydrogenase